VSAQVVIEPEDIPSEPGTVMLYYVLLDEDGVEVDLGEAGEDRHWDFTDFIFIRIDEDELLDPEEAPRIDDFEDANRVMRSMDSGVGLDIDNGLRYESLTDENWELLGIEFTEDNDFNIEVIEFPDPIQLLPMPAEYGDEWDMESSITQTIAAPDTVEELFDSLDVTFEFESTSEIDAWGTVSYTSGEADVLRQHIALGGRIIIEGVRYIIGRRFVVPFYEEELEPSYSYRWYASELGELITITSRQGEEEPDFELAAKIRVQFFDDTEHFTEFVRTGTMHKLTVTGLSVDGEPVPAGWEIGVFTQDDVPAGAAVWRDSDRISIPVYGDDPDTDEIEGFRVDEEMTFLVWDNEADEEYAAVADIEDGAGVWAEGGRTVLSLEVGNGEREIVVSLVDGWNLMSINVTPGEEFYADGEERGPDIILMTEQLRIDEDNHHIELVKDEYGRFYSTAWGFCNIPYWDLTRGYLIKVDEDLDVTWSGVPIEPDAEIQLMRGWNSIAYLPTYQLSCESPGFYVVSPIIDNLILAKDGFGRFMNPAFRFSNMIPWREGPGYQVKVRERVVFRYPGEEELHE